MAFCLLSVCMHVGVRVFVCGRRGREWTRRLCVVSMSTSHPADLSMCVYVCFFSCTASWSQTKKGEDSLSVFGGLVGFACVCERHCIDCFCLLLLHVPIVSLLLTHCFLMNLRSCC